MSKLRLLGHSLWYSLAISLVALAIAFSATRVLLGGAREYRADLERWVSEQVGAPVQIGKLRASLRGFQPELRLQDVRIKPADNGAPLLQVREIRVGFDLIQILSGGDRLPDYLSVVGTRLLIERAPDGRLSVAGLTASKQDQPAPTGEKLGWLASQGEFEVLDSEIVWMDRTRDVAPLTLAHTNIRIINQSDRHRVALKTQLPEALGRSLRVNLDLSGDLTVAAGWGGRVYLEGNSVDLAAVMGRLPFKKLAVDQGVASVRLWTEWEAAKPIRLQGEIKLGGAQVHQQGVLGSISLDQLNGWFDWRHDELGWLLHVYDFSMRAKDLSQPISRLSLRWQSTPDAAESGHQVVGVGDNFNIGLWSMLAAQSGQLTASQQNMLQQTHPVGVLNSIQMTYLSDGDSNVAWSFCSHGKGLGMQAWEKLPGLKNMAGQMCASDQLGWLKIDANDAELDLPRLFRDPFQIQRADGLLSWSRQTDAWVVESNRLQARTADIQTESRLSLRFPLAGGKPFMDLQTDFQNGVATAVPKYLPVGIMGKKTVAWLDRAFLGGRVPSGSFIYRGDAAGFPYRDHTGVFQVLFDAEDVTLDYAPDWPHLTGIAGQIEFKNEGLFIRGHQGQIGGNQITSAEVTIPDLQHSDHLEIKGRVEDDVSGLYRFFRQSPIRESIHALLEQSEITGPGQVSLDLKIPLHKGSDYQVAANAVVSQSQIRFPAWGLSVSDVQGELKFDQQGLQARSLKGKAFGEPLQASIQTGKTRTTVNAQAMVPISKLAKTYPADYWDHLSGQAPLSLAVKVPRSGMGVDAKAELELSSALDGVAIKMPQPLGKSATDKRALTIQLVLGEADQLPFNASYADQLQAKLKFVTQKSVRGEKTALERADFRLGTEAAELPPLPGIRLSGRLETLDLNAWQVWVKKGQKTAQSHAPPPINQLDLAIAQFKWSDQQIQDVHFKGQHTDSSWRGVLTSPLATGQVILPDQWSAAKPIQLKFSQLKLPQNIGEQAEEGEAAKKADYDPREIPPIDLSSDSFYVEKADLGALRLKLRPQKTGVKIEQLKLASERDQLNATGDWLQRESGTVTHIAGQLNSAAFGNLLNDLGFTSQLKQTEADILFDLNWPAPPYDYANRILSGELRLKTEKGRLLDLEPGVGRVFGLLSLGTIQRRLQLDFSDLLQKGMSFDKIRGTYNIQSGQAETSDFYLEGPAARLDIAGRIGLGDRDYDQMVTVTPKTTSSLPVAGAIAGGPAVGAAVFLAQKIFGKKVEAVTQYQYHVTGSWDDPQMQKIKTPTTGILNKMIDIVTPEGIKESKP